MANLEELVVSLVAETQGLRAELNKATSAVKDASGKMDEALEEFTSNASKNTGFLETALATMSGFLAAEAVQAVMGYAKDALGFMIDQLKEGADAAIKEEAALKRLANSMAISGQYTDAAMVSLQRFTSEMEDLTGVSDDVIASNLAVLSSLTRLDAEGLKKAQKAALDMSVALGMDLDSATQLVAKGIEGNVSMFKRYGIEIREGANKAETMANVLKKLESSFGGAAAGAAQTFGGAMKNLSNSWGNFTEALATAITKNPVVIAMMNQITSILQNLTSEADGSAIALREGLATAFITVAKAIGVMAQIGDYVFRFLKSSVQGLVLGLNAVAGSFAWIADKLGLIKDADPFARLKETAAALDNTVNNESGLGKLATMMADISVAGEQAFSKIKSSSDAVTASVKTQAIAVEELGTKQKEILTQFAQGLADQGMALDNQYQYQNQLRQLYLEEDLMMMQEHNTNKWDIMAQDIATQQEMLATHHAEEQAALETAIQNGLIAKGQENAARTALAQKQYLEEKKLSNDRIKLDQAEQAARTQGYLTFLDGLAVLSQSSNKTLAAIGKAAAISKATIDAYLAIQNALANVPYPANIAAAAGIGAQAFANVAKIAGIGFNEGGTLVGGGANRDTVPASLTKGETVVTRDLTQKLADFLDGQGSSAAQGGEVRVVIELRDSLVEFIEAKILERQATKVSLLSSGVV